MLLGGITGFRFIPPGQRIYDEVVRQALTVVWEASDRICGEKLKAALPSMMELLGRHGHIDLDDDVRKRLFSVGAATIDRLLRPVREKAGSRRIRKFHGVSLQFCPLDFIDLPGRVRPPRSHRIPNFHNL